MGCIGILSRPLPSHLSQMLVLAEALQQQGHQPVVFGLDAIRARVEAAGLRWQALGTAEDEERYRRFREALAGATGLAASRLYTRWSAAETAALLRQGPATIRAAGCDLLVVDSTEAGGGTVAEHLGLPFVTIIIGVVPHAEAQVPPYFTPWPYTPGLLGRWRNRAGYAALAAFERLSTDAGLAEQRRRWRLAPYRSPEAAFSPFAQISPMIRELDFPRTELPACFHYTGPWRDRRRSEPAFAFERLDGRPLVYASLGTLLNRHPEIYAQIAEACSTLPVQLVLGLGGQPVPPSLPGDAIALSYAPQLALLERAQLAISHAGLCSVLEALDRGVPLLTVPISFEQPGIAARVRHCGAGELLPLTSVGTVTARGQLRHTIKKMMDTSSYSTAADRLRRAMAISGGTAQAVEIIEAVLQRSQPVPGSASTAH